MPDNKLLKEHLLYLLKGDGAHLDFEDAVKGLPAELRGKRPSKSPHSPWEVLEHLRITQRDILDTARTPDYTSPEFPAGYWPRTPAPPDSAAWSKSVAAFRADFEAALKLVRESEDLFAPAASHESHTIFRRLAVLADHNAYHLGELVVVRRLLGAWE